MVCSINTDHHLCWFHGRVPISPGVGRSELIPGSSLYRSRPPYPRLGQHLTANIVRHIGSYLHAPPARTADLFVRLSCVTESSIDVMTVWICLSGDLILPRAVSMSCASLLRYAPVVGVMNIWKTEPSEVVSGIHLDRVEPPCHNNQISLVMWDHDTAAFDGLFDQLSSCVCSLQMTRSFCCLLTPFHVHLFVFVDFTKNWCRGSVYYRSLTFIDVDGLHCIENFLRF